MPVAVIRTPIGTAATQDEHAEDVADIARAALRMPATGIAARSDVRAAQFTNTKAA
jgi:hypothetical protein